MALNYKMKELIDAMTQEVINIYDIQIPITNIDEVVRSMGGTVKEDPTIDSFSDGKIRKSGSDSFIIKVSPYQTEERRNFTIAHELGHLFLHMGFRRMNSDGKSKTIFHIIGMETLNWNISQTNLRRHF